MNSSQKKSSNQEHPTNQGSDFQLTEVGWIPKDWEVVNLDEVAKIVRGGSPRPIENFLTLSPTGVNWIKIGDVSVGAKYISSTDEKISPYGVAYSREVSEGDFLLSNSMSFGRPYILKISGCIHDGWLAIQKYHQVFDTDFLYYLLSSETTLRQYQTLAAGSTVLNLNKEIVKSICVFVPPKAEQTAIAKVLSDMDALIEAQEQLIAKKRAIKQGATQELLTPKEGWEVKRLGEIGIITTGGTPTTNIRTYWGGQIPWITPTDISRRKDIKDSERKLTQSGVNQIRLLKENTLLVTCIASIGKNAILRVSGACNQQINALTPADGYYVDFLYYLIEYKKGQLIGGAGVTATLILSKNEFSLMKFMFPTYNEQTRIAKILSDMDAEIDQLESQLSKYRQLKAGMMQDLLTGRKRLNLDFMDS